MNDALEKSTVEDLRDQLNKLISRNSWPCTDVGKWRRSSGIHIGTKEAIFSAGGPLIIGPLVYDAIMRLDPSVRAIAGDGVGGTAIAIAAASSVLAARQILTPLHVRLQSEVSRNKSLIEGAGDLAPGAHVAVVDDTIDSARSITRVVSVMRDAGYIVTTAVFLVARRATSVQAVSALGLQALALLNVDKLIPRDVVPNGGKRQQ